MTDLYAILDVPHDATPQDIKDAFRFKAKEHHPDVGGNAAAFHEIAHAYAVLGEPNKRAAYDRDGTEDTKADNAHKAAYSLVEVEVRGVMQALSNKGESLFETDMIATMVEVFDDKIKAIEDLKGRLEKDLVRFSSLAERFWVEEGSTNIIRMMVETGIRNVTESLPRCEQDLIRHKAAREIVLGHRFRTDPPKSPFPAQQNVFVTMMMRGV